MVQFKLLVVSSGPEERKIDADDAGFLGAGEQSRVGDAGAADGNRLRVLKRVGLLGVNVAD